MKKHVIFLVVVTVVLALLLLVLSPLNSKIALGNGNQSGTNQISEDTQKAKAVDDLITAINNPVNLNDNAYIASARNAYNSLTDKQKALVKNLPALEKAESDYAQLSNKINYAVGDIVNFKGGPVYVSPAADKSNATRPASKCKITLISNNAKHIYHLVSLDNNKVYGWVNAEDLQK